MGTEELAVPSQAPGMTPVDHIREAEKYLALAAEGVTAAMPVRERKCVNPDLAVRLAEQHLAAATAINNVVTTGVSSKMAQAIEEAMGRA